MKFRRFRFLMAILVAVVLTVPVVAQSTVRRVTVAEPGNLDSLDPTLYSTTAPINLALNIGDTLVEIIGGEVVGVLAEGWETPAADRYVLNLRRGVQFHDGTPFTAHDVKFTLDRILNPDTRSGLLPYIALIEEVRVIDDYTVEIRLKEPQVTFLSNLSRGIVIVSQAAFEQTGDEGLATNPIATGPFKVASWDRAASWTLVANENYWRGRPEVDEVVFRVIPEVSTQIAGLLTGEIDITSSIGYDTADLVQRSPGVRVEEANGLYQEMIILDTRRPPFDDVNVRRALNHAIDVEAIIGGIFQGRGVRTTHPFTTAVFGHNPGLQPYAYDPELARDLLAQAGYADGFEVELLYPAGGGSTGSMGRIAEVVASYLSNVGVTVKISAPERVEHSRRVYTEGSMTGMALAQLINRTGDADFGIALYFDAGRRNHYFPDAGLLEDVSLQLQAVDRDVRLAALQRLAAYLNEQVPWIYIAEVPLLYGVADDLEWTANPDQTIRLYGARFK